MFTSSGETLLQSNNQCRIQGWGGGLQKLIVLNVLKVAELKWFKMLVVYNPQSVNTQHTTRRKGKIAAKADCNH